MIEARSSKSHETFRILTRQYPGVDSSGFQQTQDHFGPPVAAPESEIKSVPHAVMEIHTVEVLAIQSMVLGIRMLNSIICITENFILSVKLKSRRVTQSDYSIGQVHLFAARSDVVFQG
jgi:hypothetical protein